ncbi:von Willebrand factor A [Clostridium baratii]|uniref:vWA domain-containing protein n=1 Tax=Clostridium baratii TaxID=1561 RepID=UPI0006C4489E|nr:vWA domain-containing protein [Clostridium baratii]CUP53185.1 von Willebrand factor A [Clostridium baratii]
MKKQYKKFKKVVIAIALIVSNCFFIRAMADPYNLPKNVNSNGEQVADGIKNSKTAKPTGVEGEYEIELKVSGTAKILPTDIVMIMDKSYSMVNNMDSLKKAMQKFTEEILNKETGIHDARISVVEFSGLNKPGSDGKWGSDDDAKLVSDYSNNIEDINNAIKNTKAEGSTNAEAAWKLAEKQLDKARDKASKYVLFFTDGLPNRTVDGRKGSRIGVKRAIDAYNNILARYSELNTYSIGLIKNIHHSDDKRAARDFLNKTQNKGVYFIENDNTDLVSIYEQIANNIKLDKSLANKATISDEVTKEFEIVKNSSEVYMPLENGDIKKLNVYPIINGNKISWNLGDVGVEGRIVRFKIRLKDEYYGIGDDKIKTNVEATMDYIDPASGNKNKIIFQKPEVTVPYKNGKITIEKEVRNKDGLVAPKDDNFNILLAGNNNIGDYGVSLKGGETKELNFKLKYDNANVSLENLEKKEFLNIGEYNIKEIIPMNYELECIYINGKKVIDNKFTLDNKNSDIKIKIVNKYVNNKYFYDKDEEINILDLKK